MLLVNKKREIKEAALEAVTKGGLSIREAAKKFGINRGVVQRLASGLTTPDSVVGRPTFLPKEVEDILAQKLLLAAERAFSVPLNLLPFIAKDIAKTLKLNVDSWTAGDKWLNGFPGARPPGVHPAVNVQHRALLRAGLRRAGGDRAQEGPLRARGGLLRGWHRPV